MPDGVDYIGGENLTKTAMAVARSKRPTVRSVASETGLSVGTTHLLLKELRERLLVVSWEPHTNGTMRRTYTEPDQWKEKS